jgi:hypothetical protein
MCIRSLERVYDRIAVVACGNKSILGGTDTSDGRRVGTDAVQQLSCGEVMHKLVALRE